jgi:SAM-dependent methyltransferase
MVSAVSAEELLDVVNRPVWTRDAPSFAGSNSWTDAGERIAIHRVADRTRGNRILDVGVGAGRTTWLLPLISDKYVAVDYTPEMVALCRATRPELDVRSGDARNLAMFDDESFDLVVFSFNGIDCLSHADRELVLREFWRVLAPSGLLLFSTLDKSGQLFGQKPWHIRRPFGARRLRRSLRFTLFLPLHALHHYRRYRNWLNLRRQLVDRGGWGIAPLDAHEFGLLVHYITPDEQRAELERLGFDVEIMIGDDGFPVTPEPSESRLYFHTIARKRPPAG